MLFWPSPAQAASANGSSSIAARFAELPKMLSAVRMPHTAGTLRTFADKKEFASRLQASSGLHPRLRPVRPRSRGGAMGNEPRPWRPVSGGDGDAGDDSH